jgi:hypothetical protein
MEDRKREGYIGHRRARERVGQHSSGSFAPSPPPQRGRREGHPGRTAVATRSRYWPTRSRPSRASVDKGLSTPDLLGWPQTGSGGRRHRRCRGRRRANGTAAAGVRHQTTRADGLPHGHPCAQCPARVRPVRNARRYRKRDVGPGRRLGPEGRRGNGPGSIPAGHVALRTWQGTKRGQATNASPNTRRAWTG